MFKDSTFLISSSCGACFLSLHNAPLLFSVLLAPFIRQPYLTSQLAPIVWGIVAIHWTQRACKNMGLATPVILSRDIPARFCPTVLIWSPMNARLELGDVQCRLLLFSTSSYRYSLIIGLPTTTTEHSLMFEYCLRLVTRQLSKHLPLNCPITTHPRQY